MDEFRGKEFTEEEWLKIWGDNADFRISGACRVLDSVFTEIWNEGWFAMAAQDGSDICYEKLGRHKKEPLPMKVKWASYDCSIDDLENADELHERYKGKEICVVSYSLEGSDEVVNAFVGDPDLYACRWYGQAEEQHMLNTLKEYEIRVTEHDATFTKKIVGVSSREENTS